MKFSDEINIYISSGKGGNGLFSFSDKKKPDGGNGGNGGDVYLICDKNVLTFQHLNYMFNYKAENGFNGGKKNKTGKNGKNLIIKVPKGTTIYDCEKNFFLGKLEEHGEKLKIANGGKFGYGNFFLKNNYKKFNKFKIGGNQVIKFIHLELNLVADIGLLGIPNTGKSSFINLTTKITSKIGEYKFTTTNPILACLKKIKNKNITIADMPGIISMSSDGKGLGFNFLKHFFKTKLLLYFNDISNIKNKFSFIKNFYIAKSEILKFDKLFVKKKIWIILTKNDITKNKFLINLKYFKKKFLIFNLSSKKSIGIKKLIFNINEYFNKNTIYV